MHLRQEGIPVLGFTWYSLTDQIDWDVALREKRGVVNPRGLFDLDRKPRAVGHAYARLIKNWKGVLTSHDSCLQPTLAAAS